MRKQPPLAVVYQRSELVMPRLAKPTPVRPPSQQVQAKREAVQPQKIIELHEQILQLISNVPENVAEKLKQQKITAQSARQALPRLESRASIVSKGVDLKKGYFDSRHIQSRGEASFVTEVPQQQRRREQMLLDQIEVAPPEEQTWPWTPAFRPKNVKFAFKELQRERKREERFMQETIRNAMRRENTIRTRQREAETLGAIISNQTEERWHKFQGHFVVHKNHVAMEAQRQLFVYRK